MLRCVPPLISFVSYGVGVEKTIIVIFLKEVHASGTKSHYFPDFYGTFLGPHEGGEDDIQLIYRAQDYHVSVVTLTFTANSISFVDHRYFACCTSCPAPFIHCWSTRVCFN